MKLFQFLAATGVVVACVVARPVAAADPANLKVGDDAPTFASTDDQGNAWKSSDYVGKKIVVVYFFPAAMTGG